MQKSGWPSNHLKELHFFATLVTITTSLFLTEGVLSEVLMVRHAAYAACNFAVCVTCNVPLRYRVR